MIEQENYTVSYPFNSKTIRPHKQLEVTEMALPNRTIDSDVSQQHRDIVDNKYQELRRPRKIFFYRNGDRYFKGKQLYITPHRYLSFDELLVDLTKSVSLPYGVRKVYTQDGMAITDIEDLKDGGTYVCASFERFKKLKYGKYNTPGFAVSKVRPQYENHLYNTYPPNGSSQHFGAVRGGFVYPSHGKYAAAYGKKGGTFGQGHSGPGSFQYSGGRPGASVKPFSKPGVIHSDMSPVKPRIVKIVKNGDRPRKTVSLLLNKRSVQSFEDLVLDISDALGLPKYKSTKIRKLYTLKGREIRGLGDFFREEEVFIASPSKQPLSDEDIADIYEELHPNNPYAQKLPKKGSKDRESKTDSGFGEDEEKAEREKALRKRENAKKVDQERAKAKKEERLKAAKWEKQRLEEEEDELRDHAILGRIDNNDELQWLLEENERKRQQELEREKANRDKEEELERKEKLLKKMEEELRKKLEADQQKKAAELLAALDAREAEIKAKEKELKEAEERRNAEHKKQEKEDEERRKAEEKRKEEEKKRKEEEDKKRKEEERKEEEEKKKMEEIEKQKKEEKERKKREEADKQKKEEKKKREEEERQKEEEQKREKAEMKRKEDEKKQEEKNKAKQKDQDGNDKDKKKGGKNNKKGKDPNNKYATDPRPITKRDDIEKRYKIGKKIGDGNFADVHLAELMNTDQEFAMKIVDKSKLKGKEQMIENEIGIMKNVNHPNIVRLFEEHETKENIYLVMEYVKGGDLFDAITESVKFTEANAALMISDLSQALAYLHDLNIVHRDLKPENLLMTKSVVSNGPEGDMVLKLADFGLAMEVKEPILTVCGTPTYVAPEILAETGYGLEVDMWATGVIAYILLCGFPPFRSLDRDQEELFEIIQAGEFEYLSPYWDNISVSAKDLINHLLVVNRKKRYTAKQVLEHTWIVNEGPTRNRLNLQREITMNLEKNFGKGKNHQVGVES